MLKTYYFDAAAHEPPSPAAVKAFTSALHLGNPSALHACGVAAKIALEEARASIAQDLNCLPEEVYFTSGATEACNWMMESLSAYTGKLDFPRHYEHHAVLEYPPVEKLRRTDRTGFTHMMANNETGEIYDILSMRRNAPNALFACDATAAVGQIPVDFKALGVDYVNGPYTPGDVLLRLPGNANLSFLGVESQALVMALSAEGVYASSGSACTSGEADGSYVLRAMGYPANRARSAVRFTLPYTVTVDDVLGAVPLIVSAVEKLRRLTPTP